MPQALRARLEELVAEARRIAQQPEAPAGEVVLRQLVAPLPFCALAANDAGRYVAANRAASKLTGYSDPELRRLSVWDLTPPDHKRDFELLWRAFLRLKEQTGDYLLVTKDGRTVSTAYAARAHVLPGLHLSLLRRDPH